MAVKKTATRSKEYSESIIDTVREPLIILDHDLRVVTASRSFYDFFKVKPEETVGQLIYDLGNKQWDIPKLRELLENILPQKTTFDNYEVEHIFAAVGRRVMLLNARQIQRVSGKERIILLAIEDITERKWAESQRETALELLQESKERYRALFDRSLDLVCVIDFEGRFIDANNAALNRFGYTKEEIHSLNFTSLLSEDQLPLAFKALQDIQEAGNQQELAEFKLRHKNGSDVYVETIGSTIMSDGIPVAIQLIARDITERKRAEKELNDSEQRFSAIFRYSLACISLTRISDGKFLDVNDAFLRMTGYKREEIIGSTALDLNLWNDPECRAKVVAQLSEQGRSPGAETTWRRKSGKIIDVIVEADVIDVGGEKYILGLVNDITERKRAEKNLVYLSRQNELILTSVAEGILGLDLEGNHIFVNPAAERMLGCKVEELIGSPGHSTWHHTKPNGSPYPRAECKILATILEGTVHHVSTEIFWRKDGTSFPVEYTSTPIYEEGRKAGVVLTFADITERKQIEEKLSKSEIKYRSILENIQEGYFEIDLAGNFTFFNDSMRRLYGYSKEELMGMNYRQYADKEAAKKNFQAFNKIYTTGETIQEFNWQAIRKGGDKIYAELSASLQKDSSGKPIGFSGIVRDITERKQAEEELRLSEEKYRTFIETIQDGYYEIDLTGKYTFVNDVICKHLQYSKE